MSLETHPICALSGVECEEFCTIKSHFEHRFEMATLLLKPNLLNMEGRRERLMNSVSSFSLPDDILEGQVDKLMQVEQSANEALLKVTEDYESSIRSLKQEYVQTNVTLAGRFNDRFCSYSGDLSPNNLV